MSVMKPIQGGSLLERAARHYDFHAALKTPAPIAPVAVPAAEPDAVAPSKQLATAASAAFAVPDGDVDVDVDGSAARTISRDLLASQGMLVPGAPIGPLAEEFRLIKRQLLLTARSVKASAPERARTILVCSANPNEGKTFSAINLALSMAAERDTEILLVDADFAKPDVLARLGLAEGPGLLDALADPTVDVEACILRTDVPQLSILPAGTKTPQDTELLASERTPAVLSTLLAADPRRLIIFDSPPALAASPAATLALQVGQIMLVVRADRTSEGDLREAVNLLDGCEHVQLVLNSVSFALGGRRFGSYYGQEEPA